MDKPVASDLSVGEMARRAGVAVSTLHHYEAEGLIESRRTAANHRRYDRRELRRLAIIRVARTLGIPLAEVREVLSAIPRDRAVSRADWSAAAEAWQERPEARIVPLTRLRDTLGHCMGCGCLSLDTCPLYNPRDRLSARGSGPRRWTGGAEERAAPPGRGDRGRADAPGGAPQDVKSCGRFPVRAPRTRPGLSRAAGRNGRSAQPRHPPGSDPAHRAQPRPGGTKAAPQRVPYPAPRRDTRRSRPA